MSNTCMLFLFHAGFLECTSCPNKSWAPILDDRLTKPPSAIIVIHIQCTCVFQKDFNLKWNWPKWLDITEGFSNPSGHSLPNPKSSIWPGVPRTQNWRVQYIILPYGPMGSGIWPGVPRTQNWRVQELILPYGVWYLTWGPLNLKLATRVPNVTLWGLENSDQTMWNFKFMLFPSRKCMG